VARSVDKGHGRKEVRTLRVTSILTVHQRWRGLKTAFELTRQRTIAGKTTTEIAYGITSLTGEPASPARLLALTRDHWAIENSLHYVRDVTLREDACRVRRGSAPQVLAALRNAIIHLLASVPAENYRAACEHLQVNPTQAHTLLGIAQRE